MYVLVVEKFTDYCEPRKNVFYEWFKFYKCIWKPDQTDQFLTELKSLASSWDFVDMNLMVRDRAVTGIENGQM